MINTSLLYCATDKEVYDLFMASKRKMSEAAMLELAKSKGIFCSPREGRDELADFLASMTFDHEDIGQLLCAREEGKRKEKLSSKEIQTEMNLEELRAVAESLLVVVPQGESLKIRPEGGNCIILELSYSEIDYSRSRLIQRKEKTTEVKLYIENGTILSRYPADPKAKELFESVRNKIEESLKCEVTTRTVQLSDLNHASQRSQFFFSLMKNLKGFVLANVTNVKVDSFVEPYVQDEEDQDDSDDDQENDDKVRIREIEGEMLGVIKQVVLQGESVLTSPIFQDLQRRGYFVSSCVWQSKQIIEPYSLVEFEAAFEDSQKGDGFKYNIRGEYHNIGEKGFTKTRRPITDQEHREYLRNLEQTAYDAIEELHSPIAVEVSHEAS